MKLSVLFTAHNRAELLRKALLSLSSQSRLPDEVVISDDGSEQDIPTLLRPTVTQMPFPIKYVRQPHRGFRAAKVRNNAARLATGDLLLFLDQDIIGTEKFVQTYTSDAFSGQFRVAWPIRLTREQTEALSDQHIKQFNFEHIVTKDQLEKIAKQYRKDRNYYILHKLHLRNIGPKLRSGLFSVFREDYYQVNGFDERYQGWGNEDDDLGRRLHVAGVRGKNPFLREYPLHLYHEPHRVAEERPNLTYYRKRVKEIHNGGYRCEFGVANPLGQEELTILQLN